MKFSEAELRKLFDQQLNITTEELCHQLTMLGLEVEACEPVAPQFNGVFVGEILEAAQHPNADRLRVCQVNIGTEPVLNIVCGAPNARGGIKVAVSTIGACLPGDFKIKETQLRGVVSQGMLCSEKELGLPETMDGIIELPADAPIGCSIREYLQLDDHVITINLTPNRGDCLSLYGIARELAVLNRLPVPHWLVDELLVVSAKAEIQDVLIEAPQACPRYLFAVMEGINNQLETPPVIRRSLEHSGIRSISPVVDILNHIMLLTGQPMHAFDADKIRGTLKVAFAKADEEILLLNDETLKLRADTLTIRDDKGAIALAGIMGDKVSAVEPATVRIIVEAAYFDPLTIAGKARSYGLHTDSSHRFERGVDPELPKQALLLALAQLAEYNGGRVVAMVEKTDAAYLPQVRNIILREAKVLKLLGIPVTRDFMLLTLQALGCKITNETTEVITVQPPSFRFDLNREEDLIEELARFAGYDHLPLQLPQMSLNMRFAKEAETPLSWVKGFLVANGLSETISYSFIDADLQDAFFAEPQYKLINPITKEMTSMRKSLIPSLLSILQYNMNRQQNHLAIFETGKRFIGLPPIEHETLAGLCYGRPEGWSKSAAFDFYDLKGLLEKLFKWAHLNIQFQMNDLPAYLHPGQSQSLWLNQQCVGYLGALHPKLLPVFDLKATPFVFELAISIFQQGEPRVAAPLSKFPMIERDLAFLVERNLAAGKLVTAAKSINNPILQEVSVFDVYAGDRLPENQKSIAIKLRLQDLHRTLVDAEVDAIMDKIIEAISRDCAAVLREG